LPDKGMHATGNKSIASLFSKKQVTVLITDSGLGGLSIFAQIASRLKSEPIFPRVSLIYFNAMPEQSRGFNALKDMDERIRVFDGALEGMKRHKPDLIMIACNTLSVLYDRTAFSRRESIPVVDIVRFGVDIVYEQLLRDPEAKAVLLGTVTTIASDLHRSQLIDKGISADRIIVQACDQLATQIEKGPGSTAVVRLINTCMDQAAKELGHAQTNVVVALFCTHFGFSRNIIRESMQKRVSGKVMVLDPNQRMAASLFETTDGIGRDNAIVDLKIVSKIIWDKTRIDAISSVIQPLSAETAQALRNYQWVPDLFAF